MAKTLTKKQRGFVKDYAATGNGVKAALNNYDTEDYNTANVIAVENLQKPTVVNALQEILNDEDLAKAHKELLNQTRVEYFVFPKGMDDEEIVDKVTSAGLEVIVIRDGEKGRYAFYSTIDSNARKGALDMAYKIKGTYAPEKKTNLNMNVDMSEDMYALATKAAELLKEQKL